MSGDQGGGASVRQDVAAGGDASLAGRDLISKSQGVQVGGGVQLQVNVYGQAEVQAEAGSLAEFRADLLALVDRVDEDAICRGLPERLVPGGDVLRMARPVRLLGRVRQPPESDDQVVTGVRLPGGDRERAYALAAERR